MTRRSVRAARKASVKRTFGEPADFDMPEPFAIPSERAESNNNRETPASTEPQEERQQ